MKKNPILLFYIILLLILIAISRGLYLSQNKQNKENFKHSAKQIPYYNEKKHKRYIKYQKENPDYPYTKIATDVNIGLDLPYYTDAKLATNPYTEKVLVNKYNYLKSNYIPNNLEYLNTKYAHNNMQLTSKAKLAFEEMAEDASTEDLHIIAMSTYRSYAYQQKLYNKYVSQDGIDIADTYSARPGHSEHQTGLAVDVHNKELPYTDFEKTAEFSWMQQNAHKYGFILRYPKNKERITGYQYEPWHYRYVGIEIATDMYTSQLTYDEYYIQKIEN